MSQIYVNFINAVISRKDDKRFIASLKRADNDNLFFYSQDFIDAFIDTDNKQDYIAFAIIVANLARNINKYLEKDKISLGGALFKLANKDNLLNDTNLKKLYRLFTITDRILWCEHIGRLIAFVESQLSDCSIDYVGTLEILNKRELKTAATIIAQDFFKELFVEDKNFEKAETFFNYLKVNANNKALIANLKRASSKDSNFYAFASLAPFVPSFRCINYDVYALIAYYFNDLHDDNGCSLGEALAKASYDSKNKVYTTTGISYLKKLVAIKRKSELSDQIFNVLNYVEAKKASKVNLLGIIDFYKAGGFEKTKKQLVKDFYK